MSTDLRTASRPADAGEGVARHRPRLLGLAYRMLGEMDDAEDVVQEAYLRWHLEPRAEIRSPEAWLVTVTTRLAVDRLRRAAKDRERYVGPWLPEPIPADGGRTGSTDRSAELASDLSVALLVLLEALAPEERAAFVLREVFGTDYAEIARVLERRPDAVRQMVHRARRRVQAGRPRVQPPADAERMLGRFVAALADDDAPALLALLAPDVVATTDGGGVVTAARNPIVGADRVSRFLLGIQRKFGSESAWRLGRLNRQPALLHFRAGALASVTVLDGDSARIRGVYTILNPAKLARVLDWSVDLE